MSSAESGAATFRRRVMSTRSGSGRSSERSGVLGSSAMPHLGQGPGRSESTSGSMGQIHCVPAGSAAAAACSAARRSSGGFRKRSGSAMKRSRQRGLQKT